MRRLIINADDFGLTSGVNRAIVEGHRAGTVTSTTLMANGGSFANAVQLARSCSELSVGCHVVLIDGTPLSPPHDIDSLIDTHAEGRASFRQSLSKFAASALLGRIRPSHIEVEAIAQISRLQSSGVVVSHVDTHKHTHMFPAALNAVLAAARACGVRAIRNPFVTARPISLHQLRKRPELAKRYVQVKALRALWAAQFRARVEAAGLITPDGSFGVIETGYLDSQLLEAIIGGLPEGTWELVSHPGYDDAELAGVKTRLRQSRAQELQLFLAATTRELLAQRGIELISYRDLVPGRPGD